jgi:integrase/recombinase XerD
MEPRFEQFIKNKRYLVGVTERTVEWYRYVLNLLPSENPSQRDLDDLVCQMQEKGRKATGVNCVASGINSYLHWNTGTDRQCGQGCSHPRIRLLKEPKTVMPTFTEGQIKLFITWKPKSKHDERLHLLILFLLDVGCRISEALTLRVRDIDFDNLLVKLDGKGRMQRIVPFSPELRRAMFRHIQADELIPDDLLLGSRNGTEWSRWNVLKDVKRLCRNLGFAPPVRTVHAFRHTFAVNYLRRGGSTFHLQKSLGHSTLDMTKVYVNLAVDDLKAVHPRISLLRRK